MVVPKKISYCELFDETMKLWETYAEEYCRLLEDYYDALAAKVSHGLSGKRYSPIKKSELNTFPVITLFCIEDEDEAIEYMLNLPEERLILVNTQIKTFLFEDKKLYEDLKSKTFDINHAVRMKKAYKSSYAMSPDSCKCGKHYGKHLGSDCDK